MWQIDHADSILRLAFFSDLHRPEAEAVWRCIDSLEEQPHVILYAGDGVRSFHSSKSNYFEIIASLARYGLWAVPGNEGAIVDQRELITGEKVFDASQAPTIIGGFAIIGHSGRRPFDRDPLDEAAASIGSRQLIVLSHYPPHGHLDLAIRHRRNKSGRSGMRELTAFVEDTENVRLLICGHAHIMGGKAEALGTTTIVNAASHDQASDPINIGITDIHADGTVHPIRWEKALLGNPESLALQQIPGIGPVRSQQLIDLGIETIKSLENTSVEDLASSISGVNWRRITARARALCTRRPVSVNPLEVPVEACIYLDIETDLDQMSLAWMTSVYCPKEGVVRIFYAPTPDAEKYMLEDLSGFLRKRDESVVHYSLTNYDKRVLVRRFEENSLSVPVSLKRSIDLGIILTNGVGLPVSDYKLRSVARWAGYDFAHPGKDGIDAATAYKVHIENDDTLSDWVFEYATDDVCALAAVVHELKLHGLVEGVDATAESSTDSEIGSNPRTVLIKAVPSSPRESIQVSSQGSDPQKTDASSESASRPADFEKRVTLQNIKADATGVIAYTKERGEFAIIEMDGQPKAVLIDWERYKELRQREALDSKK